jgi:peptidyl-tRNA hydrolase
MQIVDRREDYKQVIVVRKDLRIGLIPGLMQVRQR